MHRNNGLTDGLGYSLSQMIHLGLVVPNSFQQLSLWPEQLVNYELIFRTDLRKRISLNQ